MTDILTQLDDQRLVLGPATEKAPDWRHWRLARESDGTAWLVMDREDAAVNILDEALLEELGEILRELRRHLPRALILRSAKPAGFCAGADIGMFRHMTSKQQASEVLRRAHDLVDELENLPIPRIAVIHGQCLGGGLELALACDRLIAIAGARLGFPEVQLGLHPGLGGSFRATRRLQPLTAMQLMLTGKPVDAARARKMGLVDAVTEERHLIPALGDATREQLPRTRRPFYSRALEWPWMRTLAARRMTAETRKRVSPEQYPAPFRLIDLWHYHGGNVRAQQKAEIDSFAELVSSTAGQNLVRVFFLQEGLKKQAGDTDNPVKQVHVVGAGTMGGDIAAWCALQGLQVTVSDPEPTMIAEAIKRASTLYSRKRLKGAEHTAVLDRLIPDPAGEGVGHADLVIEAGPEKIDIKRGIYRDLQPRMKDSALLATNTSSIPLETLREEMEHPERFLGLHFFNPVAKMQLVEVVSHDQCAADTRDRGSAFANAIGRLPVPVSSAPGFLVNRVLTPYLLEAMQILDEGMSPETLDRAAETFGMPMGPAEMADQVGLDICLAVADMLRERLDTPLAEVPRWLRNQVKNGQTGRKAGRGLYRWNSDGPQKNQSAEPPAGTADRLMLPLVNTAVACLREGVVADADVLDGALIFGTGFAPFRGGPLHYARQRGIDETRRTLDQLAQRHGERLAPDPGWKQLS